MTEGERRSDYHKFRTPLSINEEDWKRFGTLAGDRRRAEVLRAFIAWYVGKPGAKMPRRPKL